MMLVGAGQLAAAGLVDRLLDRTRTCEEWPAEWLSLPAEGRLLWAKVNRIAWSAQSTPASSDLSPSKSLPR